MVLSDSGWDGEVGAGFFVGFVGGTEGLDEGDLGDYAV
jgi:hypothetical protein